MLIGRWNHWIDNHHWLDSSAEMIGIKTLKAFPLVWISFEVLCIFLLMQYWRHPETHYFPRNKKNCCHLRWPTCVLKCYKIDHSYNKFYICRKRKYKMENLAYLIVVVNRANCKYASHLLFVPFLNFATKEKCTLYLINFFNYDECA